MMDPVKCIVIKEAVMLARPPPYTDFLKTCYFNNIFTYQAEDKFSKMLVPLDGSELFMKATDHAVTLLEKQTISQVYSLIKSQARAYYL
jgi:hypothetical protein